MSRIPTKIEVKLLKKSHCTQGFKIYNIENYPTVNVMEANATNATNTNNNVFIAHGKIKQHYNPVVTYYAYGIKYFGSVLINYYHK